MIFTKPDTCKRLAELLATSDVRFPVVRNPAAPTVNVALWSKKHPQDDVNQKDERLFLRIKLKRKSRLYSEAEEPDESGPPVETRVPLLPPSDPDQAPQSQIRCGSRMAEKRPRTITYFPTFIFHCTVISIYRSS